MNSKNHEAKFQEDSLKAYFEQIKNYPLLNHEEEIALSKRILKGDELAVQELVQSNLRLVVKIAKAYMTADVAFIDIIQEGNIGLMTAAEKFDYKKDVRFSTYASWWIKQAITRSLSNKRRAIRLPHRKEEALRKIQRSYNVLSQKLMRTPSTEEVAADTGIHQDTVMEILTYSNSIISLDNELQDDGGTMYDLFEDDSYTPERVVMKKSMREDVLDFLQLLMDRERKILMYRFAFYGGKKYTLKKISDEMGISPETVRQIEMRAMKKLQAHSESMRAYIYN